MVIQDVMRNISRVLLKRDRIDKVPIAKDIEYINSFREPKDDIERSFFQYKCQMKNYNLAVRLFFNLASFFVAIADLIVYRIRYKKNNNQVDCDAVFFRDGKDRELLPNELREEFVNIETDSLVGNCLNKKDLRFLGSILVKYPCSWFFFLKLIIKVSRYRNAINLYNPKAIISCNEFSFTSSVLTEFCHSEGIEHINVMHGDRGLMLTDTFFHFDRFYVWNEHYIKLFEELRCKIDRFVVSIPEALLFKNASKIEKIIDYTYYLQENSVDELEMIQNNLDKLRKCGYTVAIRPHPRFSNIKIVEAIFKDFLIEDNKAISIQESVLRTRYVVAFYSTVLLQAYLNSVDTVIDDIVNPIKLERLKNRKCLTVSIEHKRLSDIIDSLREVEKEEK